MIIRIESHPAWQGIQAQWLNLWRMPAYSLPTLIFPVAFYVFFGLLMLRGQALWLLCTFATFGVMGAALFSFGVGVAMERAQGWWRLLKATPVPFASILVGKLFGAMLFGLIIVVMMAVLAAWFGEVRLPRSQWLGLAAMLVAGTVPFALFGLALGLLLSPNAAPAVVNIIYLPLGFLSGLWVPVTMFPDWLETLAAWLPPYHLAALALKLTGQIPGSMTLHWLVLLVYTVVFAAAAWLGWRRFTGS